MIFCFEDLTLDTDRRELRRGAVLRSTEPQVFDLLEYLIRNRERVVSTGELFNAIWPDRIVSNATLSSRINAARSAIDDNGTDQRLIRTLRTKGLRFVGKVHKEIAASISHTSPQANSVPGSFADRPLLAVLPFANIGGQTSGAEFADGITEELIIALSKAGCLPVASQNSSFAFKRTQTPTNEIARKLGAQYVLEGAVRKAAGRVRISAQLIDMNTGQNLWADQYEQDSSDVFVAQDLVKDKIMDAIEPQIYIAEERRVARASPEALRAWDCIVRALSLMNRRRKSHVASARRLLHTAVTLDPGSAQAHALLSIVSTLGVHMGWTNRQAAIPAALIIAHKALSLNPDEPWAHAALGYAMIWREPEDAVPPLEKALALNPRFSIAHYFHALASSYAGQTERVFDHADMAERFARRDLLARGYDGAANNVRATACFAGEHYRAGAKFARKAIVEIPNAPTGYRALIMNLALGGSCDEARSELLMLRRLAPEMSQDWIKKNAVWAGKEQMKRYVEAFRMVGLK